MNRWMTTDDMDLVREYAASQSERAFEQLVARHLNLVYSAALRCVNDASLAEEITQAVFIILARKAGSLGPKTILSAWLYRTARYCAADAIKNKRRRQNREQEAYMQSLNDSPDPETWTHIAPLLDAAMGKLGEKEHNAIVLRFFEGRDFKHVGSALGVSEEAAKKRVSRALEKLRLFFAKRGVVSTTAIIGGIVGAHSVQAAPGMLAKSVTASALTQGAAVGASTLTLIQGALKIMAWTKIKTAATVSAVVLLSAGSLVFTYDALRYWRTARMPDIQGAWECEVAVPLGPETVPLHAVVKFTKTRTGYQGTIDEIERGIKDFPLDRVDYAFPKLRGEALKGANVFEGTVDTNTMEISGAYWEPGFRTLIVLKRTDHPTPVPDPLRPRDYAPRAGSDLQGLWKGVLKPPGGSIRLNFKIAEVAAGQFRGQLDNLDGASGQWLTVAYQAPTLKLIVNSGAGMFRGQMNAERTRITGVWIENGTLPLSLERGEPLYHPIPDHEPDVTGRMWALKIEKLTANDCTPEFWRELQQARKSENPQFAKAVLKALGPLRNVTLVERTNDAGRPSYLYQMEYENMNALLRLVLDGQKIAYVKGYPEPE